MKNISTIPVIGHASSANSAPPVLAANKPFRIYQVELSSRCNMQCSYCPHPVMQREQGAMSAEVLAACLKRVVRQGSYPLVLHHFGEPLLHPELRSRLLQIADAGLPIMFSTNGLLLDESWDVLRSIPATIYTRISVHQWASGPVPAYLDAIGQWRSRAKGTNIRIASAGNVNQEQFSFHKWTEGDSDAWDARKCIFIRENLGVVLWNGDIATCCADHEGVTASLNILDPDCDARVSALWPACATCDVGRNLRSLPWEADTLKRFGAEG